MPDNIKSIIIFRTCGLGDFIISIPAFIMLRAKFPDAHVTLVTMATTNATVAAKVASYAGGLQAAPWINLLPDGVVDKVVTLAELRSVKSIWRAKRALRHLKPDLVIQMMDIGIPWKRRLKKVIFSTLVVGLARQVGWRLPGMIEQDRVPKEDPSLPHHVHGPLHFMKELYGADAYADQDVRFELNPGQAALTWRQEWIARHTDGCRLISIAPGAVHPHKDWPLEHFKTLAATILADYPGVRIVISGTKNDVAKANQLIAIDPKRILSTCGIASIAESAALFERCDLVIGNDGGAMHLADAMGTRVISIVPGLEFPRSIEPWNNIDRAIRHPVDCAPCYSFTFCPQGHNRCMRDLQIAAVMRQVRRAMQEIAAGDPVNRLENAAPQQA